MQEIIKYQEIDSKLRRLEAELFSSANRKGASEMQQLLKDGQAKLIKLESTSANLSEQYNKATQLYSEFVNKLETLQKSVEGAKDEKLAQLETTIANLVATGENLDNNISALAGRIAAVNREFENIMNNAKKAKHNLEIYKANYLKEREKFEPEINKLKEELTAQRGKVDPKLLAKYNSKKEGKIFPVFVRENKGGCGGCRMAIPAGKLSTLKTNGMVECENCGRIIFVD